MNEFDKLTITLMEARIETLRRSEKAAEEREMWDRAVECKLRANHLEREVDWLKTNLGPWLEDCPECHHDLGSNQEECKTCFDSHPENEGHCHACGEIKGMNDDCADCCEWAKEKEDYRFDTLEDYNEYFGK